MDLLTKQHMDADSAGRDLDRLRRFHRLITAPEVPEQVRPALVRVAAPAALAGLWEFTPAAVQAAFDSPEFLDKLGDYPAVFSRMPLEAAKDLARCYVDRPDTAGTSPTVFLYAHGEKLPSLHTEVARMMVERPFMALYLWATGHPVDSSLLTHGRAWMIACAADPTVSATNLMDLVESWATRDFLALVEWVYSLRCRDVFLSAPERYPKTAGMLASTPAPFYDAELCVAIERMSRNLTKTVVMNSPFLAAASPKFHALWPTYEDPSTLVATVTDPGFMGAMPIDSPASRNDLDLFLSAMEFGAVAEAMVSRLWAQFSATPSIRAAVRSYPAGRLAAQGDPWAAAQWAELAGRVGSSDWEPIVALAWRIGSIDDAIDILL